MGIIAFQQILCLKDFLFLGSLTNCRYFFGISATWRCHPSCVARSWLRKCGNQTLNAGSQPNVRSTTSEPLQLKY
jgi:hypothetical protein